MTVSNTIPRLRSRVINSIFSATCSDFSTVSSYFHLHLKQVVKNSEMISRKESIKGNKESF